MAQQNINNAADTVPQGFTKAQANFTELYTGKADTAHTHPASAITDFDAEVTAAGALMDSELTAIAAVKALDQGVATTDSPQFAAVNIGHATDTTLARIAAGRASIEGLELNWIPLGFACSDETTALTTGQKIAIDMPFGFTVTRVYASLSTAGTTSAITVDVEDEGVSILAAVLSLAAAANNVETSTFAASASSYALSKGDLLTIDIDAVDSGGTGAGLKVFLLGFITSQS